MLNTTHTDHPDLTRRNMLKYSAAGLASGVFGSLLLNIPGAQAGESTALEKIQGKAGMAPATVFFTKDISPQGIAAVFAGCKSSIQGRVALKLHVGDPGNTNFISPDLVKDLCTSVNATLCDSNVFYGGQRAATDSHQAVAKTHGFNFADYDVLDAEGEVRLPIAGGRHMSEAIIGKNIMNYDSIIVLSHVKGHQMAGYGGAIKNIAMGIASKRGKGIIHGGANWSLDSDETKIFLERLVEFGKGMEDARKGKIVYINVLNKLSMQCDCASSAPDPVLPDIGIIASTDIVAVEKASLDLIYRTAGSRTHELIRQIEAKQGPWKVEYAQAIGMGNASYTMVTI